jgi:hypothetical protein
MTAQIKIKSACGKNSIVIEKPDLEYALNRDAMIELTMGGCCCGAVIVRWYVPKAE